MRLQRFDSLTEAYEAAKDGTHYRNQWGSDDWYGGSVEETTHAILRGWTAGVSEATEKSRRIVDRAVSSRSAMALVQDFQPDVVGAAYDVGGYCSGVPECWVRPETVPVRRAISVCVNVTASGGIEASTLRKRGIAVASLVLAPLSLATGGMMGSV